MDRRLTPFSGRIAHVSLQGQIVDAPLTKGEACRITAPLAFLRASPGGAVDRQLIHGDAVTVIDRHAGHAFGVAEKDGYCGWIDETALGPAQPVTHRVRSPATHLYPEPRVQAPPLLPLYLNAQLAVTGDNGLWAETPSGFVPSSHLATLDQPASDPVSVAETLLGAPYLWGGNSVAGVDCSGLVQLAFHAAGRAMPGDSDLQSAIGTDVAPGQEERGDLIFWKGHVALVTAPGRIIHANGHTMNTTCEDLAAAITRIAGQTGAEVTARKRP